MLKVFQYFDSLDITFMKHVYKAFFGELSGEKYLRNLVFFLVHQISFSKFQLRGRAIIKISGSSFRVCTEQPKQSISMKGTDMMTKTQLV